MDTQIHTPRLVLRRPQMGDAPRVQELASAWEVARMTGLPHPYPENGAATWLASFIDRQDQASADKTFAIVFEDQCIGIASLMRTGWIVRDARPDVVEVGYWLGQPYWGRGFMTESVTALLDRAFQDLERRQVVAGHFVDNPASARILAKLGFRGVGPLRHFCAARGVGVDAVSVALDRDTWAAKSGIK